MSWLPPPKGAALLRCESQLAAHRHPEPASPPQFDDLTPTCTQCGMTKSVLVFASLHPPLCETCHDAKDGVE